jgi:xanthine dehydrogenase accessory factor
MKDVAPDIRAWWDAGEDVALATLVNVERSAPRRPGARFACTASGKLAGSVSAGCVESDVFERAQDVLRNGRPVLARYDIAEEEGPGVGLSCGGSIDVLIEPFGRTAARSALLDAVESGRAARLAVVVAPDELRGRAAIAADSPVPLAGVDAALDPAVAAAAAELAGGGTRLLEVPWRDSVARVYVEVITRQRRLVVVGATHVALPLCRMAKVLDFHVTVVDPRSAYATPERLADADTVVRQWPEQAFDAIELDASTYLAILTHDAKFDIPTLKSVLRSDVAYIGAMASRRTHAGRLERLRALGFTDGELARIHSPIGLDLGGRDPEEIALAILAEITALRHGRR